MANNAQLGDVKEVGTPAWWVARLSRQLNARKDRHKTEEDYFTGKHPLAFASQKFRSAFGGLFAEFSDNWCPLIIEAVEERLNVRGLRIGEEPKGDKDAWRIWQANALDAGSVLCHTEAMLHAEASVLVWADPDDDTTPAITIEHPSQMAIEHVPGSRERAAALKRWRDDWTGKTMATLYLPDAIYKLQSRTSSRTATFGSVQWDERLVEGETWPLDNPLGVVPVVPFENRPRLIADPESEIAQVIPIQDAVNKLVLDMMLAAEFAAMKRRWATGIEIPEDPETHQPIEQFDVAVGHIWAVPDDQAKFGEFSETQLSNYVTGVEMLVQHLATRTRTPPHYFFLKGQFPSGESIKSAETGLVAKVKRKMIFWGEGWEEVMRLAFLILGDDRAKATGAETIWGDPESRSESEHIDALVKKKAVNVPDQQLWEDAGYTQQQIERFGAMRKGDIAPPLVPPPAPVPPGAPPAGG